MPRLARVALHVSGVARARDVEPRRLLGNCEDSRLVTGRALLVDDVQRPGMLHAAFLCGDRARARIRSLDARAARTWLLV